MFSYLILALPLSVLTLLLSFIKNRKISAFLPYALFFSVPILTYSGVIGTLSGFDREGTSPIFFGITFYAAFLAYHLAVNRAEIQSNPVKFIIIAVNPIYLFTGPILTSIKISAVRINLRNTYRRFRIIHSDLIIGVLFCFILSTPFKSFFYLRDSANVVDIILFGIFFEFYVYFNFAGYSMITWSFMRLLGLNVQRNFNQPFSAVSLIDYWKRWHISLSTVLKELFFKRFRQRLSLYSTVVVVFFASALWHGVAINFLIWGLFHAILWCIAHFLSIKRYRLLNYFLLIIGVVIGRVIFAENRTPFLQEKLKTIFCVFEWETEVLYNFSKIGYSDSINLFLALFFILLEIFQFLFPINYKYYPLIKSPLISLLLAIYVFLFLTFLGNTPVYGIR